MMQLQVIYLCLYNRSGLWRCLYDFCVRFHTSLFFLDRTFFALQLLGQFGDGGEEISDESVVSNLEDGSLGILVDGNNGLGVLHTSQMLDGSRNTDCNVAVNTRQKKIMLSVLIVGRKKYPCMVFYVQLRGNNLSSLSNLERVVDVSGIDGSTGSTN